MLEFSDEHVCIAKLQREDIPQILQIEQLAYSSPWSFSLFENSVNSNKDECWALKIKGEIQGYAITSHILDEAHLLNICIHPEREGKGLGRKLLRYLIERAIEQSAKMFFLEVRDSNKAAIDLYLSEGFNEVGIRPNYYPSSTNNSSNARNKNSSSDKKNPSKNSREDALLMTLELSIDQFA